MYRLYYCTIDVNAVLLWELPASHHATCLLPSSTRARALVKKVSFYTCNFVQSIAPGSRDVPASLAPPPLISKLPPPQDPPNTSKIGLR